MKDERLDNPVAEATLPTDQRQNQSCQIPSPCRSCLSFWSWPLIGHSGA